MNTEAVLTLTQWLSPGFPVGAYAYSHGLERAIDRGDLRNVATLKLWLEDILAHGGGLSDAICLVAAYQAEPEELAEIDAVARSFAASSERLTETCDQGAAFARTVDAIWATEVGKLTYPVAVGRAAKVRGYPLELTTQCYVQAFAANLISAAVRLVPLGQTEGQNLLAELQPLIRDASKAALSKSLDDLTSTCFAADIVAMQHEVQYSKVFRT
jgi:urease accessory protein